MHGRIQDGNCDGYDNKNSGPHHMQTPYEWSGINTRRKIRRRRRQRLYLNTPLKRKRYGKVRAKYIPEEKIRKHDLEKYIEDDGWLHFEIGKGMYGIPEAGRLANDLLRAILKNMDT